MPLLNHFAPPLSISHPWMGFHSVWATHIAAYLNETQLPARYYAVPNFNLAKSMWSRIARPICIAS